MKITPITLVWLFLTAAVADAVQLPSATVTSGICVQIAARPNNQSYFNFADLDMMQAAGIKYVRADLSWPLVEKIRGQYNFGYYNLLANACEARGIGMLWTLDHWNDAMYPATQNLPTVDAWRQAYANFAAAAVDNFQGRNCLYEIWNEPDQLPSWPGGASNGNMSQRATQYTALVQQAVPAMRQADPTCTIMGASLSSISYTDFIRPCLDQGLLDYVDAVSVHPYRNTNPETAMPDYNTLSNLINAYGPTKPVVVSEWGYSSSVEDQFSAGSAQSQGDYMARAFLINLSRSISLTSFYDWGMNDSETGFGIVTAEGGAKPAYDELRLLTQSLYGETFRYRLSTANPNDWLLVFQTPGGHQTLAAWTTGSAHSTNVTGWGPLYLTGTPFYVNPSPIPEPDALLLLTIGLVGFLAYGRRHSRKTGEIAITGVVGRHACLPQSRGRHNLA